MKKPRKVFDFTLIASLIEDTQEILKKCVVRTNDDSNVNGLSFDKLTDDECEELWRNIQSGVECHFGSSEKQSIDVVLEIVSLLETALKYDSSKAGSSATFIKLLALINERVNTCDEKIKSAVCKLNEIWLSKKDLPVITEMSKFSFYYITNLIVSVENPQATCLKRLYAFGLNTTSYFVEENIAYINKLVQHKPLLTTETGRKFLAHVVVLSEDIFLKVLKSISLELSTCSTDVAKGYGVMLSMAWHNASDVIKHTIQMKFQNLMEEFIGLQRTSLVLPKRSKNVLLVIDEWNMEVRKKGNDEFTKMIARCYEPILWKYLQHGMNYQRVNAADLFLKAFPLHALSDSSAEISFVNKQVEYMENALRDNCPIVRIIAVREVLNILPVYWSEFTQEQIHKLMTIIIKEDAADTSTSEVPRTVWRGLVSFVKYPPAFLYLKTILPDLQHNMRDKNVQVRIAFIQLLLAVRDENVEESRDIIDLQKCLHALARENQVVGRMLVKLILPYCYNKKMPPSVWIRSFCSFIREYPHAYRNFFMYSSGVLSFQDAHNIICELILNLGEFVKKKQEESDDDSENSSVNSNSMRISKKITKALSKATAFENLEIVAGMFDIVTILWSLHYMKEGEIEFLPELYRRYLQYAQRFISYYKDTPIFNSVICLSGNVPSSFLTNNSITLPGYCMKLLMTSKPEVNTEEASSQLTLIVALIKWGCGKNIFDQVTLWIEAAFASVDSSCKPAGKKVRIAETIKPDPMKAVELMNLLLSVEHSKSAVLKKNYNQLHGVWKLMGSTMALLFRRFLRGTPYPGELLSDEFLLACFRRYVKLIPLLKQEESQDDQSSLVAFNHQEEMFAVIQWVQDDIVPLLHAEEQDCPDLEKIVNVVNDVLYTCDNMITIRSLDLTENLRVIQLAMSLVTCGYNLHFVNSLCRLTTALNYSSKIKALLGEKDTLQLRSAVVPSLFSNILNALVAREYSKETFNKFTTHAAMHFRKILGLFEYYFTKENKSKKCIDEVQFFAAKILQAVKVVLSRVVPLPDLTIPVYSSLATLPAPAALVLTPVYNSAFWTPMFLLALQKQLGRSEKMLFIDILIIHLFGKINNKKWLIPLQRTHDTALSRLKEFKQRRESGGLKRMGLSLSHVVEESNEPNSDDEDNNDANTQKSDSSESQPRSSQSSVEADLNLLTLESRPSKSTDEIPTKSRRTERTKVPNREPASSQALSMDVDTVSSQPTLPSLNSRPSEPNATDGSQAPSDVGMEPLSSQTDTGFEVQKGRYLASQVTTWSSQPVGSSQQATVGSSQNDSPRMIPNDVPEEELIDDFICCGEELLKSVQSLVKQRSAPSTVSK